MTRTTTLLALILSSAVPFPRASAQPTPQTARQALLEMFFSKTPGTLGKHLPEVTQAAMQKAAGGSGISMLDSFALVASQLQTRGQELQTFEAGPILLTVEDRQAHTKFEITVERDDLQGEADEIELGLHNYKDGQPQTVGLTPRFTFTMKQEKDVWRLNQIAVSLQVSLTDPEFLKAIAARMSPSAGPTTSSSASSAGTWASRAPIAANEASAVGGIRTLNTAEVTYAAVYPDRGFTCNLSDLGGMGSGQGRDAQHAMLIDPRLATGRKNGYVFSLSGCDGNPVSKYNVAAVPADPTAGTRAFCSNESAVIRSSPDGNAASCLNSGKPLQ